MDESTISKLKKARRELDKLEQVKLDIANTILFAELEIEDVVSQLEKYNAEIERLRAALRHYACDCEQGGMPRGCNGGEKLDPDCGWTAYVALREEK